MAICARCTGLYAGVCAGGLVWALGLRRAIPGGLSISIAAWALVPMAADVLTQMTGWRESTNVLRLITGSLGGSAAGLWFFPLLSRTTGRIGRERSTEIGG